MLFLIFVSINLISAADGFVDNSCSLINNYVCSNSPSPCSCNEPGLNCQICEDTDEIPCSECIYGYFRPFANTKCVSCNEIFSGSCNFCTNIVGCQQCADGSPTVTNDCGLQACGINPLPPPSSESPSALPTSSPTTVEERFIHWEENLFTNGTYKVDIIGISDDYDLCIGNIGCGGEELLLKFTDLCDVNLIFTFKDINIRDNQYVFYTHYGTCYNSLHPNGMFFYNFLGYFELDVPHGKIVIDRMNFMEETDVDFIKQFFDSQ